MVRKIRLTESELCDIICEEVRKFRTYGLGGFNKDFFKKAENNKRWPRNKPIGGLWATPVDAELGWLEWNRRERFMAYDDDDYFEFTLKPDARVYVIKSREDVANLPQLWDNKEMVKLFGYIRSYDSEFYPDFEKIGEEYDAIEFHENGDTYWALSGWDCDCMLVLNPDAIEIVKNNPHKAMGQEYHARLGRERYKN